MNVFETHTQIVDDYAQYIRSFINISDPEIARKVEDSLSRGASGHSPCCSSILPTNRLAPSKTSSPQDCCMMTFGTSSTGTPCIAINARHLNWAWTAPTSSSLRGPVQASH